MKTLNVSKSLRLLKPVIGILSLYLTTSSCLADLLYISNAQANSITAFNLSSGTSNGVFATSGLSYPVGIALNNAGNLFVGNYPTGNIVQFDPAGTPLGAFANIGTNGPSGSAFDTAGNLFLSDEEDNLI